MTTWCWLDGRVSTAEEAWVPALDHGLTVGDGAFETLKVVGGTPFALTRHLARLRRSLEVLGLEPPLPDDELRAACAEVVDAARAHGTDAGRLRITVTGGPGPLGSGRHDARPTVLVAVAPAAPWPPTSSVVTVPWTRNERGAVAGAKTTSYAENVVALREAYGRGADEALLANSVGALCEGTGTNVFVVHGGVVRTPSLATGCLAGITRALVLETSGAQETDRLTPADLSTADEVFLTSSTRDVHPVAEVDGLPLPEPVPGPLTSAAAAALAALEARDLDP